MAHKLIPTITFYLHNGNTITQPLIALDRFNRLNNLVVAEQLSALRELLRTQGYIELGGTGETYKLFAEEIEYSEIHLVPEEGQNEQ